MTRRLRVGVAILDGATRGGLAAAAGLIDLTIRLWLAQTFLVSGLLKLGNWDNALYLAAHEYPVSWLDPGIAAIAGAAVELICPIFLALGLFTRIAAVPMLALSLVIQFSYVGLDVNLFWAALFGWFVAHGAGGLSVDRLIVKGLASSAVPFAGPWVALETWLDRRAGPSYRMMLRLWLGAGLAGVRDVPEILPVATFAALPAAVAIAAPFIAAGFLTPIAAAATGIVALGMQVMAAEPTGSAYLLLVLALLGSYGAGPISLDNLARASLLSWLGRTGKVMSADDRPHVVIVGAGFGGVACAHKLRFLPVRVTLVDRRNYHLFQPLLYQIATASLSPGDIATPIRALFRDDGNIRVLRGTVTGIDTAGRQVILGSQRIGYDFLVLATGASHSYFGMEQWAPFAPGLKRVEDAIEIRRRVLSAFEDAEATSDPIERAKLLTFVIVGAGPTGVELSGAIAELARHGLTREFRSFDPVDARIILVQSGARILPTFPEALAGRAKRSLELLGVDVRADSRVEMIDRDGVMVSGRRIPAATVLWAAGVIASPAAKWLNTTPDRAGRVRVGSDLAVLGLENVYAIGDTAMSDAWNGQPVPGLAPAAKQGGEHVARVIRARLEAAPPPPPFRYRHQGSLATIGRKSAIADFGWLRMSGASAWWLWGLVHIFFLVGVRNRLSIMVEWCWSYLTYGVGVRLITGEEPHQAGATIPLSKAS